MSVTIIITIMIVASIVISVCVAQLRFALGIFYLVTYNRRCPAQIASHLSGNLLFLILIIFLLCFSNKLELSWVELKPQSNGPLYSSTVIGTLAVGGWAVVFGMSRIRWLMKMTM